MRNINKCLINEKATIFEAVNVIECGSQQIALVVDEEKRLVGIITDVDIRRAIINNISMDSSVLKIMTRNPIVVNKNDGRKKIKELFIKYQIQQIPILDEKEKVFDIVCASDVIKAPCNKNAVILMLGGLGSRLKELTANCPKPMLKIGDKPILEIILKNFIEYGFSDFYFSVNYKAEMIEKFFKDGSDYGVSIKYIREQTPLGTAGSLHMLPESVDKPFIVMNGDILTKINFDDFINYHESENSTATIAVRPYTHTVPYGVLNIEGDKVVSIQEKPKVDYMVSAGIYAFNPEAIKLVPDNKFYNMNDLINDMISSNMEIRKYPVENYWIDIGLESEYQRAQIEFAEDKL